MEPTGNPPLQHDQRHLDVPPHLYVIWLECLLTTIREFDPKIDSAIEDAWRHVMQQRINLMIARH
jgi:hemoglobin-like flavoprotein